MGHFTTAQLISELFMVPGTMSNMLINKPQLAAGYSDVSSALYTFGCQQTVKELTADVSDQCLPFLLHL